MTVIFNEDTDIYRNRQVIAERLSTLTNQIPKGITPNITPLTSSASTVLGFGLTSQVRSLMELRTLVDWTITPHLLAIPGVADVNVFGGEVRQFQVHIDPNQLIRYQLNISDVVAAAERASGVSGAGYIENSNQRIIVNVEAQATSANMLAKSVLLHKDGLSIKLGDIGRVTEGAAPSISAAAINGETGIYLSQSSRRTRT